MTDFKDAKNYISQRLKTNFYNSSVASGDISMLLSCVNQLEEQLEIAKRIGGEEFYEGTNIRKPPIGLKPKNIHMMHRIDAIDQAMVRYMDAKLHIPQEWFDERNELVQQLLEHKGEITDEKVQTD